MYEVIKQSIKEWLGGGNEEYEIPSYEEQKIIRDKVYKFFHFFPIVAFAVAFIISLIITIFFGDQLITFLFLR